MQKDHIVVDKTTTKLAWHKECWKGCKSCDLYKSRTNVVLYRGDVPCDLLFIGEAPGPQEDQRGEPFVGPSGDLLELLISEVESSTSNPLRVCFTNVVACYPGEIRPPTTKEINACRQRLSEIVSISKPKGIVYVGRVAARRQKFFTEIPYAEIVHPASLLRDKSTHSQMFVMSYFRIINLLEKAGIQNG
jgi:uracil-DNA glycosylase